MKNKSKLAILAATIGLTGTALMADDTQPVSENAVYALGLEHSDGTVEKLIAVGDHEACMQLAEQAEEGQTLVCVPTAPVASQ